MQRIKSHEASGEAEEGAVSERRHKRARNADATRKDGGTESIEPAHLTFGTNKQ